MTEERTEQTEEQTEEQTAEKPLIWETPDVEEFDQNTVPEDIKAVFHKL